MKNDYELDVVFRISEEKKKIKFSRSEVRDAISFILSMLLTAKTNAICVL